MKKRLLVTILSMCMCFSMGTVAFADTVETGSVEVESDSTGLDNGTEVAVEENDVTADRVTDEEEATDEVQTVSEVSDGEVQDEDTFTTSDTVSDSSVEQPEIEEHVEPKEETLVSAPATADISYQTHVQNYGWQSTVANGNMSGTSGQALRLEGIRISLKNQPYSGSIQYRTHVQDYGWQGWVSDGAMSGTQGQAKRLEAIQIQLTGEMAKQYDIYYQVHAQNFGWMGWASNGAPAGTAGYAYRLEAIRIVVVKKGSAAPGSTYNSYAHPLITYQTHVQNIGWQSSVNDGKMSGTTGRALRLEGIKIQLNNPEYAGSVRYRTHVQNIGWQDWSYDYAMSGTTGKAYRLEGIQIELTGAIASVYDIYYRVHAQNFGWLGWAKNGAQAGTAGYAYRLEGIEIRLVPKGGAAPGSTANAFYGKGIYAAYNPTIFGMSAANRAVIRNMLGAFETGGQIYGNQNYTIYVGPNTNSTLEKTITLGAFGFYGVNAQRLIANILAKDPAKFRSIDSKGIIEKRLKDNWEQIKWNPNEEQKKVLIALISSDIGRKCQDELLDTMTSDEIRACQDSYTDDTMATMMYVDLAWQGGRGAANRVFNQLNGNYSLDNILEVLKRDQKDDSSIYQLGDTIFWRRRTLCKQWIEKYVVG